jgi:prepilin-type N-terminal cleavage/methylation domain-containing protein
MSDTESGFTLVEVLVALAITVLSMAVLFKVISTDLDRTRAARDGAAAESLAQSLLAQYTVAPRPGVMRGTAPGGYAWHVDTAPYADAPANLPVDAVTVAATVSWRDNGRVESRSLSTLRILPKALPQ